MRVNKLTSVRWQVPYAFYSVPFCQPHTAEYSPENLGEVLQGSVIQNAPFELRLGASGLRALCKMNYLIRIQMRCRGISLYSTIVCARCPIGNLRWGRFA